MAVILSMTYQKKLGLPNFSSHSCSVSLTVEIPDVSVAAQESAKLYTLLQTAVDADIQEVGFMPDATTYGLNNGRTNNGNGHGPAESNGNGHRPATSGLGWACTVGQQNLILQLVHDHQLDKVDVEAMAQQLFGVGVKELNKMQASNLIDDLLEKVGKKRNGRRPRWQNREGARS